MDGKQLKNSILQWAIQGKLVPQNPKDESAQKLLERIAASRNEGESRHSERSEESSKGSKNASLRGAKAMKQSKALSSRIYRENGVWYEQVGTTAPKDISDEIPFEIPESWAWCRIGDIFYHTSGKQQSSSNKKGSPQKFITTSNLYWGRFVLDNVKVMNFTDEEIKSCSATKGDLLVCEGGAGYGRSAIWNEDYDICLQNHIHRLRPCVNGICEYVYYFIYLLKETNRLVSVGTAMPGLSANRLKGLILPLPPLAEQKRIVAKLEQVLPLAEEYGAAQEQLDKLNKELPEALKKSILQEAIQGKLVPQNPKDEPASVLLAKIRKEKESLVKQGKLKKKDLEITPIDEEEIPFEIPESWVWCRIKDLSTLVTKGTTPRGGNVAYAENGIGFLRAENVAGFDSLDKQSLKYVGEETHYGFLQRSILQANDILITIAGTLGRTALVRQEDLPLNANQAVALIRPIVSDDINLIYLIYALNSPLIQKCLLVQKKITAIPNLTLEIISDCCIPLPPLAEQKRIVAKLEQLFKVL
ncbi:restriction endonuclease subunit S [Fibrobacter sp. UWB7]|uniref:restriction endonuclease subunit S n=1 Tax=Fibrobacter sp. UWB7 TaxID=1896206 RepID=UPI0009147510|nr:restriction endonuclease subunit S [Fibrobacter sp. UWB7]SHM42055.1 type I restriction enzyme, S subunit [Fibrobacter sp. UWB7]